MNPYMRNQSASTADENQPVNLTGCSFASIPDTGIQLCHPIGSVVKRLEVEFDIPSRMGGLLKRAREGIGGREIFLQDHRRLGHSPDGNVVYTVITILATAQHWRGGWFVALVPPAEVSVFQHHLENARAASVDELRTERKQHGSRN